MDVAHEALQRTLVELIDLSLQGKHAHWNVRGATFREIHKQLDEFVEMLRERYDEVAERLVAIGGHPDGRINRVAGTSGLGDLLSGAMSCSLVVSIFAERLKEVGKRVGERVESTAGDPVSQNLLIEVQYDLDKWAWLFWATESIDID